MTFPLTEGILLIALCYGKKFFQVFRGFPLGKKTARLTLKSLMSAQE